MPFTVGSTANEQWGFTTSQWLGLMAAGVAATAISIISNVCVLILHAVMTWYRPIVVNRLSLRIIVVSVVFNMIYCACQLVTEDISNQSFSCRVIAYVLIASDTMACMCLAMVGLNLVMIFVLKVSRSIKLEMMYYLIVIASGVLVCVIPQYAGTPKGPKHKPEASCWYHYYFSGRFENIFNWMWYYSWLMFSSVFAALCAAISIRFVMKKQENFNGALDMFTRRNEKDLHTMATIRKYAVNNTDVFQKIARRCICYPLVPLISKSWGIGIEIAATQSASVPYTIYVIDRAFSCLLGFMISCIYFTDPAIIAVVKQSMDNLKQKYVHDYFSIKYQPGTDSTVQAESQYPKILKIVPVTDDIDRTPGYVQQVRSRYFSQDLEIRQENTTLRIEQSMLDPFDHHTIDPTQFKSKPPSHKPNIPTITIETVHHKSECESSPTERRYSVLSATSINGNTYMPNEETADTLSATTHRFKCLKPKKSRTIPMHRTDNTVEVGVNTNRKSQYNHQHRYMKHTETVEILVPYRYPQIAKIIHCALVNIFRVKVVQIHTDFNHDDSDDDLFTKAGTRQDGPSRMFRDFTDGSPEIPPRTDSISFDPHVELPSVPPLSEIPSIHTQHDAGSTSSLEGSQPEGTSVTRKRSMSDVFRKGRGFRFDKNAGKGKSPEIPPRRASSINVASLQRNRMNKKPINSPSRASSPLNEELERANIPNKLASSIGLTKILSRGKSMSFSWSRIANTRGKNNVPESPLNLEPLTADNAGSAGDNSNSLGHTRSKTTDLQEEQSSTMNMDSDQSIDATEPALSLYPRELSPRPRTQYKKPSTLLKSTLQDKQKSAVSTIINDATMPKAAIKPGKGKQPQRKLVIAEDDQSMYLSAIFQGVSPSNQNIIELDIINKHDESDKKSPDIKRVSDLSTDQQEGFSYCYTTIDIISNWQEGDVNDDSNRLTTISESWDLRQQLKQQLELADDIAYM